MIARKKKRIIIIASIVNHYEYYVTLHSYFKSKQCDITFLGKHDVLELINEKVDAQISSEYFIEVDAGYNVAQIVQNYTEAINQHDVVLFDEGYGTPYKFFKALKQIGKHVLKIKTVHNINTQLKPRLYFHWKNIVDNIFRTINVKKMDALLVCSPVLKDYIKKNTRFKGRVFSIPFIRPAVSEPLTKEEGQPLSVAIPGGVNATRRNYNEVLDAFEELFKENLNVSLKLIGQASKEESDQKIIERSRSIQNKYGKSRLMFWEERLSTDEFEVELQSSDLILSNLEPKYDLSGTEEVYGVTKESGITYHMLNHAKPALVARGSNLMPELDKQSCEYNDATTLKNNISALLKDQVVLDEFATQAHDNSVKYQRYFDGEFEELYAYIVG